MCAATAAAVGTAVAAVATVGTQVAGALSGPKGGSAGSQTPQTKPIPGFAPATGLQSYTARMLAANRDTKTPGILDWAASGGTARPDWKIPDFTPQEAQQLKFVDKTGKAIPGYDPSTDTNLTGPQQAWLGQEKARNLKAAGYGDKATGPQIRYGQLAAREEMLQNQVDAGKANLAGKLARVQTKKAAVGKKLGV